MRPIGWGILVFIASGLIWVISSFGAAVQSLTGQAGSTIVVMYISGAIFFFSLPVAIAAEIVRWRRRRQRGERVYE